MSKTIYCQNCNSPLILSHQKKFCTRSCAAQVNNRKYPKRGLGGAICKNCQTPIHRPAKFCGQKCMGLYHRNQTDIKIENGGKVKPPRIKIYLIEKNGHQCEICNNSIWIDEPIPLEIDHIDGDITNNQLTNLQIICPNCHAQTSTYKGKNVGNPKGEQARRKRYYKAIKHPHLDSNQDNTT